jgi:uncharacterized protein (TIGR03067 family)
MRRMTMVLALVAPFLAEADDKAISAERKAMIGTWVAVGGEAKGKKLTKDELPLQWTFRAGGKAVFANRTTGTESPFTYTIDPSKKPKAIDITYEGPIAALKNTKQFGIYKIEKDKLTISLTSPGATEKDRPKEFTTKTGGVLLMTFERAKGK